MSFTDLSKQYLADSERWFPDLHLTPTSQIVHFGLGLAGEAGEVANLIKKFNRGSIRLLELRDEIAHEIADVIAYALDLAAVLDIDVDEALSEKRAICEARWG